MLTILDPKAEVRDTHDVSLLLRDKGAGNAGVLLFSDLTDFDRFVAEVVQIHSEISTTPAYVQLRQPDFGPRPTHTLSSTLSAYTDGASRSNPGPAACAYVVSGNSIRGAITYKQYLGSRVTNNLAEYQGMLLALTRLVELTAPPHDAAQSSITIHSDSQLVVEQIKGNWKVRDAELKVVCSECQQRIRALRGRGYQADVRWIRREENQAADQLCNQALNEAALRQRAVAQ